MHWLVVFGGLVYFIWIELLVDSVLVRVNNE